MAAVTWELSLLLIADGLNLHSLSINIRFYFKKLYTYICHHICCGIQIGWANLSHTYVK